MFKLKLWSRLLLASLLAGCVKTDRPAVISPIHEVEASLIKQESGHKPYYTIEIDNFYSSLQNNIITTNCFFFENDVLWTITGTGFPIGEDKDNYYVLTDKHVLTFNENDVPSNSVDVILPEIDNGVVRGSFPVGSFKVVAYSSNKLDIALIKIPKNKITFTETFKLAGPVLPSVGTNVTIVGNPGSYMATVSPSIICRYYEYDSILYIQTTDMARKGSSGSFLITKDKKVIGILQKTSGDNLSISLSAREIRMWLDTMGYDFLGK